MPKIYEYFGLIFLFHANDHAPIHVHVRHGETENKLEYLYKDGVLKEIKVKPVKGRKSLSSSNLKGAMKVARARETEIARKWFEFYVKNKKLSCVKIIKKL